MDFFDAFKKWSKKTNSSTYQTSFESSKIAAFRTCENETFKPLFPLVGRVGKNGFWYNKKAVKRTEVAKAFLQEM